MTPCGGRASSSAGAWGRERPLQSPCCMNGTCGCVVRSLQVASWVAAFLGRLQWPLGFATLCCREAEQEAERQERLREERERQEARRAEEEERMRCVVYRCCLLVAATLTAAAASTAAHVWLITGIVGSR